MSNLLKENAITKLSTTTGVDMQTSAKVNLFSLNPGKKVIVTHVMIRNLSGSLAGGTDYDFGAGAAADTWKTTVDLSAMTATSDCIVLTNDNSKYTILDGDNGDVFGIKPITGSTGAETAAIDVFGYQIP